MKLLKFLVAGIVFGVIMTKGELISWYRIIEMFRFESFHMYGVIGSAVFLGIILIQFMKRSGFRNIDKEVVQIPPKAMNLKAAILGGTIFGLGWALIGACPGPMFVLLGHGYASIIIVVLAALLGTFVYGVLRPRLPH